MLGCAEGAGGEGSTVLYPTRQGGRLDVGASVGGFAVTSESPDAPSGGVDPNAMVRYAAAVPVSVQAKLASAVTLLGHDQAPMANVLASSCAGLDHRAVGAGVGAAVSHVVEGSQEATRAHGVVCGRLGAYDGLSVWGQVGLGRKLPFGTPYPAGSPVHFGAATVQVPMLGAVYGERAAWLRLDFDIGAGSLYQGALRVVHRVPLFRNGTTYVSWGFQFGRHFDGEWPTRGAVVGLEWRGASTE